MVLQKFLLEKYCDFFQSIIGISFICKIKAHALKPHLFWFSFFPSFIDYIVNKWSHNNSWEEAPNFLDYELPHGLVPFCQFEKCSRSSLNQVALKMMR